MEDKPKTVWVVEDEDDISLILNDALEFKGFNVHKFKTADSAINALAEQSKPDAIITDYATKSDKHGIDVIKVAAPIGIPTILWTAGDKFHEISAEAKNAGASEVFQKPANIGKIVAKAVELVSGKEKETVSIAR